MKWMILLLVAFLSSGSLANASGPSTENTCKKSDSKAQLQSELKLSEKQREQVKALHESFKGTVDAETLKMKNLNTELSSLLQTPGKGAAVNEALVKKFKEYQLARNQLYLTRFELALKTRDLLTDEQIKKYKAFSHERGAEQK